MKNLPKDVVELITNKLSPKTFFNFYKSEIGLKNDIWVRRIEKDFGILLRGKNKYTFRNYKVNPKQSYLNLFVKTSTAVEQITRIVLDSLGEVFLKFMRNDYKETVYDFFFNYLLEMLNEIDTIYENNIHVEARYYFSEFTEWKDFFPVSGSSDAYDIEDIIEKYSQEIFLKIDF